MKRTLTITLAAITAVLILVACSKNAKNEPPKENEKNISYVVQNGEKMPELVSVDGDEAIPEGAKIDIPVDAPEIDTEEVTVDIPKALRVGGITYFDTGKTSTQLRCGVMDGELIYSVPEDELPTQDNECNFGVGYGYQWGFEQDTIEVCMDDAWHIFAVNAQDFNDKNNIEVTKNSIKLINDGMLPCKISDEEAQKITDIISTQEWETLSPDCLFDVQFNLGGYIYNYSMSCGSLRKVLVSGTPPVGSTEHNVVYGYAHVSDEETEIINGIIKNHIRIVDETQKLEKPKE